MKKALGVLLLAAAGTAMAGTGVVGYEEIGVRRIPQPVVQGIKDRVVLFNPSNPCRQVQLITDNVEAYFALQDVPNSAAKRQAAADHPYDFTRQLYLAQRTP